MGDLAPVNLLKGDMKVHCHAARFRFGCPFIEAQVRSNFDALMHKLRRKTPNTNIDAARLWIDPVPAKCDGGIAVRRREAEMKRPVNCIFDPGWRAVALAYECGVADLILVASRALLDAPSLARMASVIIFGEGEALCSEWKPCERWGQAYDAGSLASLPWLTSSNSFPAERSGTFSCELTCSAAVGLETLEAAAAITVAQYSGSLERPFIATGLAPVPAVAAASVLVVDVQSEFGQGAKPQEYTPFLTPPHPLTLVLYQESHERAILRCSYCGGNFDEQIIARFTTSVAHVCSTLPAESGFGGVLSPAEAEVVAALGRPAYTRGDRRNRIEKAFAQVVRQSPDALALVFGPERLSYGQLDQRANRIARVLRERGVRDGDCVGVCLEPSLDLPVVLLGVMKAGATYVPMDATYPSERLAFISRDSRVSTIVTSKPDFPAGEQIRVLVLTELNALAAAQLGDTVESAATSEDIAYIIYTSGSTGRPKGVAIPHRNILSLVAATKHDFALSGNDIWTLFHSSAFDFSVWELWGCLLTGGRLVVVPYWVSRTPADFAELLAGERVTILNQTPSAFSQLIEADRIPAISLAVRLIIFGGEPLNTRMLLPWLDRHPESQCRLVNMFGITETTVHVTAKTITRNDVLQASRSVGWPLPGWHVYITDSKGRLLPPGAPGEICVGGEGVGLHYVNRPDLTCERFVPDPFAPGRIYRSGDKGRLRPDGQLDHLGRLDSQVKIRGFRIELDEIQSVLLDAPGVVSAAVVVHQEDQNDPASARIHAYVVMGGAESIEEVRQNISRVLAEYMLPATITAIPALPLTQQGKLDTARLPKPAKPTAQILSKQSNGEPHEKLAAALQQIWQAVLKAPVGLDDNFFDAGGNSLYAAQIATAMRAQGLPRIPFRDLYIHQTIRKIARSLV
jgi:amino acid adenylation domain-containing protein